MIDSYSFGKIVIDGKKYTRDLIIYPDRVDDSWWREQGHKVSLADIKEVLEQGPEVLVVGEGSHGLMKILPETKERLEKEGVELLVRPTKKACEIFNQLSPTRRVIALLHLTC
ncbi:MAG: hypothetical protein AMS15_03085 [Planctomycetes bacterium DG_23]|nr:MAG: hypothetical protein AMS15_03085 [Planctomycetes bacterium DG_23]